jgi:hypothetical protein
MSQRTVQVTEPAVHTFLQEGFLNIGNERGNPDILIKMDGNGPLLGCRKLMPARQKSNIQDLKTKALRFMSKHKPKLAESDSKPQLKFRPSSKLQISPDHVFDERRESLPPDTRWIKTQLISSEEAELEATMQVNAILSSFTRQQELDPLPDTAQEQDVEVQPKRKPQYRPKMANE